MNRVHLITVDYENHLRRHKEIDVMGDMIQPTYRLMKFFESFNIPITFFVNAPEIQAFQRHNKRDYDRIHKQLQDITSRGHDIQMHWHPQWLEFQYVNGQWQNHSQFDSIKNHSYDFRQEAEAFKSGVAMLRSYGQSVTAFRGGGYLIQPIETNFHFLKSLGFTHDSSVYDWEQRVPISKQIKKENDGNIPPALFDYHGLTEVPICTIGKLRWDMSNRVEDASSLQQMHTQFSGLTNPHFVMMGHNKQTVHYSLLRTSLARACSDSANKWVKFSDL